MEDYKVLQTGDEIQEILNQAPVDTADIAELKEAATSLDGRLKAVEGKIPSGASSENPLTDKQYVDSSIASASATFRGTYNEVTDLELTTDATHADIGSALDEVIELADSNDYCFVQIPTDDETPMEIDSIERYKFVTGTGWEYEYTLNNSGFTAGQWAAINSGITSGLVTKLTDLPTNAELENLLNGKANATDVYTKSETYNKTELDAQLGAKANSADVYEKSQTYTKQEVDALITTPEVQYVTVTATSGTTSVTDVLPATGAANTIYRVGSWDGTQYATGVYSEYSWNGTTYILLDVKNYGFATGSDFDNPTTAQRSLVTTVGSVLDGMPEGVFDVSARNSGSTWASLSALLSDTDLDTLIPASWRKGGMTIRFVQTSDNKYVQYRLMAQNFTTNVIQWQGVDDEPTAGSDNLVQSGGVSSSISTLANKSVSKADDSNNILSVCDGNGEIILKMNEALEIDNEGNVKTASFDSENVPTNTEVENIVSEATDGVSKSIDEDTFTLSFSDGENILVGFNSGFEVNSEGNVKTSSFDSSLPINPARSKFPILNTKKEEFKWLDIGNSHSLCSLFYLKRIAVSQGVDLSKVAFCRVSRGGSTFKSWVEGWHDEDTSGTGDQLTGGAYNLCKDFGGLSVKVTGNTYTEVAGTPTPVVNADVTASNISFWGGDCSILRSLLTDNKFDLITIHQRYIANTEYDNSDGWRDHSENGYLTEFVRIIKTYQPQACVGCLFALLPWKTAGSTLTGVSTYHKIYSDTIRKFMADTGIDIVLPCDTALENLRNSSVPNEQIEGSATTGTVALRFGFNYDSAHTAYGAAGYTMSCVAWETVLAQRYDKSCYGNTYRELAADDYTRTPSGSSTSQKYLQGSYTNSNDEKVMIDDGAYNAPMFIGCTSSNGGTTWNYNDRAAATIRVSDTNAELCQMSAILAVNDMWAITNPDNIEI